MTNSNRTLFKTVARTAILAVTCLSLTSPSLAAFTSSGDIIPEISDVKSVIKSGNYRKAIGMLNDILSEDGSNADALNLMGYSQRKNGNKRRGEAFYLQALKINPNHLGANEYLGELYVETGYLDQANKRLSILKKACGTSCSQYKDLAAAIAKAK